MTVHPSSLEGGGAGIRYALTTEWLLATGADRVWSALTTPEEWPRWWRYVQAVERLEEGDADGIGAVRRYTWSSRLPYRLTFRMTTTAMVRPALIEGIASGELNGVGRWRLVEVDGKTRVQYEWIVTTGKRWMKALGPVLAPLFEWNHDQVMVEGGCGIARHLGVPLLGYTGASRTRR